MVHKILLYPDKRLKLVSKNIKKFDAKLHLLLEDMKETMLQHNGIGLAAIQIGVAKNVVIISVDDENEGQIIEEIINPIILEAHGDTTYQEGCLSVPDVHEDITRKKSIKVRYFNKNGNMIEKNLDGLMAIAFQHELDHLEGHLFIEKLSYLKRKKFEKEWKKKTKKEK
ncbi:MAG: peptide deformylase [Sulfurospirillum sp.]|nr:peptide deformylase [Sulfurospirillum sp.]MBL0703875.1 peptide deformylase [Sulfurospirillum sp.]